MTKEGGVFGFTGTRHGMAPRQWKRVRELLWRADVLHLGDCLGADVEAWEEAVLLGCATIGHPPISGRCAHLDYNEVRAQKPFLERNKDIVAEGVDGLIAAPRGYVEELRSGTWATVRYARKLGRNIWIVLPDGSVKC